jgi:predicted ribosomally synthesized peptide with SipW-like signal peptide
MKRLRLSGSLLIIALLIGMVVGASTAFFSDSETSTGNTFQAGGFDLLLNENNDTTALVNFNDLKPGDDVVVEKVVRIETNPGRVWMHIKDLQSDPGELSEPEEDYENINGEQHDIENYLTYDLYFDASEPIISLEDGVLLPDAVSCWIPLGVIPGNQNVSLFQSFHFDDQVGNWAQGDTLTFTEEFWAIQDRNNDQGPPETGSGRVWSEELKKCMTDLVGSHALVFTCTSGCSGNYPHTMNVSSHDLGTGSYSGTGNYDVNSAYTWDVTGNAAGAVIDFVLVYTGLSPGYTVSGAGSLVGSSFQGTASSSAGQEFTWTLN